MRLAEEDLHMTGYAHMRMAGCNSCTQKLLSSSGHRQTYVGHRVQQATVAYA